MKKLWLVEISRTAEETILVYAEDQEEAEGVARDEGNEILEGCFGSEIEAEATEVVSFRPDAALPLKDRLKAAHSALPEDMEGTLPYGDFDDLGEGGDELTARQLLERLIAERADREAREAEDARQARLFDEGAK